ncbi:acyl-CoA dehydrogenase family protein [Halostella litorea]|uniref:acyl-CoA dehydrogenase family protein n=1 Tax=Halostella litorea TaxID=2528831 RepID=UPI001091CB6E|nr:acyl-CoA dehydrogenase family protein [Halostella litorea]
MDTPIDYGDLDGGRGVDYWALDRTLQSTVRRVYGDDALDWAEPRLAEFGALVGTTVVENAAAVEEHGPELRTYDEYGDPANDVRYHPAQYENERLVYESGIVADCFRAPPGRDEPLPFTHNLAMQYLLSYADPGFDCPVAMTTGVALVLEKFADRDGPAREYYEALTARDYDDLIEGAMFLTERQGGSDVGATETTARYDAADGVWRLDGEKWFCSNVDAEGTLALARPSGAPEGTDGLSLFLVPHTAPEGGPATKAAGDPATGELNDQTYRRLKDKLGTISVPTGEVELHGAGAHLIGDRERGFKQMAEMLNLERLSNAAAACGLMGRALLESKVHAADREAFGKRLDEHPLMAADLVDMAIDHEAATAFTFEAARLFSERERAVRAAREGDGSAADPDDTDVYRLMRLLIPIAKARTGRMAVDTASYAMEVQGGNGYVSDFPTHRLLRDAQVLPIWEGTENVLSLDVLRALDREAAHEPLLETVTERLDAADGGPLSADVETVRAETNALASALAALATEGEAYAELSAKRVLHYVFDVFTAALLLATAREDIEARGDARTALVARRFVDRHLRERDGRGVPGGDRLPLDAFDGVVRYATVDPDAAAAMLE